jgi:hypothetical protein
VSTGVPRGDDGCGRTSDGWRVGVAVNSPAVEYVITHVYENVTPSLEYVRI